MTAPVTLTVRPEQAQRLAACVDAQRTAARDAALVLELLVSGTACATGHELTNVDTLSGVLTFRSAGTPDAG